MPQPTSSDVHVNAILTTMSVAYVQSQDRFIATDVMPVVPVQKQSDRYFVYSKADFNRIAAEERAPATESVGGGWSIDSTPTYRCKVYAIHKDIDDQTRANADLPLNMDRDATIFVTQQLLMQREKMFMDSYMADVWGNEMDGYAHGGSVTDFVYWDDFTYSHPIADIQQMAINIIQTSAYKPNVLVLAPSVYMTLTRHPDILDRIKYTQRGIPTAEIMAALFDVERVVVPWAVYNTAAEFAEPTNETSASMAFMSPRSALLAYVPRGPSIMEPAAGYTFAWTGMFGAGAAGIRIKSFRMEHLAADRIEGEMAVDMKLISADVGGFFDVCTSA